jgi:ABC-type lipoprotein export system ATPase subunit
MTDPLLIATDLHRTYRVGSDRLHVLRGVDLQVRQGEWLTIVGSSGSGKSTLLHLLGGLDRPNQGRVTFAGRDIFALGRAAVNRYRSRDVGFVFQFYHLLPELNALQNVSIAAMIARCGSRKDRARDLLTRMGLGERLKHRPGKLSGGERQRVAIARALVNEPALLLADEPTGNLDAATGAAILDIFRALHAAGQTIVMVTHDERIAAAADRRLALVSGQLTAQPQPATA